MRMTEIAAAGWLSQHFLTHPCSDYKALRESRPGLLGRDARQLTAHRLPRHARRGHLHTTVPRRRTLIIALREAANMSQQMGARSYIG